MAGASDTPSDGLQSKPAGISTKIKSLINRKIKGTVSLESQSGQLISPDGTRINVESLPDTVSVHVTESTPGNTTFDHTIGTQRSAKGQLFIAFTDIQGLHPAGRWILGRIIIPITTRPRAAKSKYMDNWHNFTLLKVLDASDDWQNLKNTNRCINLQLGANWCVVELTVAIEDLDVTVTTQGDQDPVPIASTPPRQAQELEEQMSDEPMHIMDSPHPNPLDTAPSGHENLDDIPLTDMFGSDTDKDAAASATSSVSLSQSELENVGNIATDLAPLFPQGLREAQAGISSWLDGYSQLSQISTPKTNTLDQRDETAQSTVSSFSNLSSHASDSDAWINSTDLTPFTKGKFKLIEQMDVWMAQVLNHTSNETTITAAETLRILRSTAESAAQRAFASGCLVNPAQRKIDILSIRHAVHFFCGHPTKLFLRALRDTKRTLRSFKALLLSLIGNGELSNDKIANWIGYGADHSSDITPGSILNEDLALVDARIDIVHRRRHVEYGVLSPGSDDDDQLVTNESMMLPDLPQTPHTTPKHPAPSFRPPQPYQAPRTLPQTAVKDMMKNLDSGSQKFGSGLCTRGSSTPSEASSDCSMTSSARVIMNQVALLDQDSGLVTSQLDQQRPPTPRVPAKPRTETTEVSFQVPVKSQPQDKPYSNI